MSSVIYVSKFLPNIKNLNRNLRCLSAPVLIFTHFLIPEPVRELCDAAHSGTRTDVR